MKPISSSGLQNLISSKKSKTDDGAGLPEKSCFILYVEDDENNRIVAKERLGASHDLHLVSNAKEACFFLADKGKELDVILMDIELQESEMDGVTLTSLIRGMANLTSLPDYAQMVPTLDVPIIFVTAYGHRYEEKRLLAAGGDLVIRKPVNFVTLKMALTEIMLRKNQQKFQELRDQKS